ncbi:MAG: thiamine pyrophosphate-dependent dehydrogenase E1 component subunit alpha [Parachlamydiaceae bacterium]
MSHFDTISYLDCEGRLSQAVPEAEPLAKKALQVMIQTRLVDERMVMLQRQGAITFAMSGAGEEACAVSSAAALDLNDWMYPQYREGGILFWREFSIGDYVHHMFGDAKDLILGRQMPNHFGSKALNVVTVSSPIGTKIPHAAGAAYAMRMQGKKHVVIAYFGEGATSEGDFHVGLNFAAVRKAPCLFFCRNNGYAISTPTERQFASDGIAPKGEGYGMATYRVDGNDFFALYDVVSKAKKHALEGKGPSLIEAMTYRMGAHSTSDDPSRYRKEEEVEKWKKNCPVKRLSLYLEKKKEWSQDEAEEWKRKVNAEIDQAIESAKSCPKPPIESLIEHVYFEVPRELKEQLELVKREMQ